MFYVVSLEAALFLLVYLVGTRRFFSFFTLFQAGVFVYGALPCLHLAYSDNNFLTCCLFVCANFCFSVTYLTLYLIGAARSGGKFWQAKNSIFMCKKIRVINLIILINSIIAIFFVIQMQGGLLQYLTTAKVHRDLGMVGFLFNTASYCAAIALYAAFKSQNFLINRWVSISVYILFLVLVQILTSARQYLFLSTIMSTILFFNRSRPGFNGTLKMVVLGCLLFAVILNAKSYFSSIAYYGFNNASNERLLSLSIITSSRGEMYQSYSMSPHIDSFVFSEKILPGESYLCGALHAFIPISVCDTMSKKYTNYVGPKLDSIYGFAFSTLWESWINGGWVGVAAFFSILAYLVRYLEVKAKRSELYLLMYAGLCSCCYLVFRSDVASILKIYIWGCGFVVYVLWKVSKLGSTKKNNGLLVESIVPP